MTNLVSFVSVDRASDDSWGEGEIGHGDDLLSLRTLSFVSPQWAGLHQAPWIFEEKNLIKTKTGKAYIKIANTSMTNFNKKVIHEVWYINTFILSTTVQRKIMMLNSMHFHTRQSLSPSHTHSTRILVHKKASASQH